MIKRRRLGRTGLEVSEVGFGAWGIGKSSWIGANDDASVAALTAARDAGVTFFDTALVYGGGHSEQLIARTFGRSSEIVVASKAPPKNMLWPAPQGRPLRDAYPREHVFECLDSTLRNLKRETVDLYQFHVWSDDWADEAEWQWTVEEIRRSGKARFVGISINDHEPTNVLKALDTNLVDVVQVIYNIFDQSPQDRLFSYCRERDIGVVVRVPFDEGGLTGSIQSASTFPEGDFRNRYFAGERKQMVWERAQAIAHDAETDIGRLPELALRFCLSPAEVATVIPGMRTTAHVQANAAAAKRGPLSPELLTTLRRHRWARNFYPPAASPGKAPAPLVGRLRSFFNAPRGAQADR